MEKKLYKNKARGKICGVCAGIAEYLNVDVTIIRLIWIILVFAFGTGILAYFVCALIMPDKKDIFNDPNNFNNNNNF